MLFKMRNIFKILTPALVAIAVSSCGGLRQISYFQDSEPGASTELAPVQTLTVDVADRLSIVVSSKNPVLAVMFNLPTVTYRTGTSGSDPSNGNGQVSYYTVDSNGNIDFPVLGTIHVGGLTREQIAEKIKNEIVSNNYIKDAVVTVEFADLFVTVLGEVKSPGRVQLDKDKVTILDVISKAGDLTINGLRTNVKVFREENGRQVCYNVDLTSSENIFTSPVYYMHQDDVVYVEPNRMRARQSTVNGNNVVSASFWISLSTSVLSLTTMILTLTKYGK